MTSKEIDKLHLDDQTKQTLKRIKTLSDEYHKLINQGDFLITNMKVMLNGASALSDVLDQRQEGEK